MNTEKSFDDLISEIEDSDEDVARIPTKAAGKHGRELTKHASIEAGIGPICAEKWGL